MPADGQPDPQAYDGLEPRPDAGFPRVCPRCQRQFPDLAGFIAETNPIFHSSGLMERDDPAGGTIVLLMRNCTCGTTLAVSCGDRRDSSERGAFRRTRFETMVSLLVESGVQPAAARQELRRMLHI